jgi:hypothetical protein
VSDASLAHLLSHLGVLEARVRTAVARRREGDPNPDDPFRGLYLTDDDIGRILAGTPSPPATKAVAAKLRQVERKAGPAVAGGPEVRLSRLGTAFGLDALDLELLVVALAPDVDSRFERLYGYLQDDVTRKRASIGLAFELCGLAALSGAGRDRLSPGSPLRDGALIEVEEPERPYLTRPLRVPDRVTAHLLGSDRPDAALAAVLAARPVTAEAVTDGAVTAGAVTAGAGAGGAGAGGASALARVILGGCRLCYLREKPGSAGRDLAGAVLDQLGREAVTIDLTRLTPQADLDTVARVAAREAQLRNGGLIAGPVEALLERGPTAVRAFADLPGLVLLTGQCNWDPLWARQVPVRVDVAPPTATERAQIWATSLNGDAPDDPGALTAHFRLTPEQVHRGARAAQLQGALSGGPVTAQHILAGVRTQNAAGLERLARRIEPAVGWAHLVLPPPPHAALRELATRARHREQVIGEWGMQPGGGRGRGITALFAGDSGTGKTMSAEVIAGELGLDLYSINLSTVVDKYVGETEKNLERIFTEADGVNAVLLFDEADALFGKRSEVRDAHDRYANIEVAYLLQRMESFDGLAILSTNMRANLDEAFLRRLDAVIDFPMPDPEHRRVLWERSLSPALPRGDDLDLEFCAERFELSGGNIRSVAITAAYTAAGSGQPVAMLDLVRSIHREYRKLGRLCNESEFGPWLGALSRGKEHP